MQCKTLTKDMLVNPIEINVSQSLNLSEAMEIAATKASQILESPMLLAWLNGKTGEFSPKVECCSELKPGWLVYAESRGGDTVIDINDEEFVFVYRESQS